MSAYLRPKIPGACIFFTVALANRGTTTLVDQIDLLRDAVRQTRRERPFGIEAWVVLPDHLHAVWTLPEGDADFSTRWRIIKTRFTRAVLALDGAVGAEHPPYGRGGGFHPPSASKRKKGERGLWQRRFYDRHIRNDEEFSAAVRYCHLNPVKHGFVERAEDWPYSSVHREIAVGRWVA
ncbi:MAG: transposase [Pseudomonadota bacterium]